MPVCRSCNIDKDISKFRKRSTPIGHYRKCRECQKIVANIWLSTDAAKEKIRDRESRPDVKLKRRQDAYAYSKTKAGDKVRREYRQSDVGRLSAAISVDRDRKENPQKHRARQIAYNAKRRGDIIQQSCAKCGDTTTHAHHCDYSKPLDVMWLCKVHHTEWHMNNIAIS